MARITRDRLALYSAALAEKGLRPPVAPPLPLRADRTRAPLSRAQERLFFLELYEPGTPVHNDAVAVRIEGALDELRLWRAFQAVAERHEVLRTAFVLGPDGPEQHVHAPAEARPVLAARDCAGAGDALATARRLAVEEARRPFALEQAPLWRATLLRLGPADALLVVTMHHLVSDGASMGLLFDELAQAYAEPQARRAPLAAQFGDFAADERARGAAPRLALERDFWRATLAPARTLEWPARRGPASRAGAQVALALDAAGVAELGARARAAGATSNHWLLATWLAWLGAQSGASAPCTGFASSLRRRRELEPLIGFFVESLPLVVPLAAEEPFAALVARVRAAAFAAVEHGTLPFDEIARSAGATPLALQAFFSHMHAAIRAPELPGARTSWSFVDPGVARFELALVLHEAPTGLTGFLELDHGVFAPGSGAELAAGWQRLLAATLARPAEPLATLVAAADLRGTERGAERRPGRALPPRRAAGA
ncbi:MAG TPA: condensation domain-containing protein [Planctomycetota bacterium]